MAVLALATALGALLLLVAGSGPAAADSTVDKAGQALRSQFAYSDPAAESALTDAEVQLLENQIASAGTPIFLAVLPKSVLSSYGNSAEQVLRAVAQEVGQRGTYGVVVGSTFQADNNNDQPVATIAAKAGRENSNAFDVLTSFVSGVDAAYGSGSSGGSSSSGGGTAIAVLVLIAAGGGALVIASRRSRKRAAERAAANLAEVRPTFEEDVTRLGEDIDGLDLDVDAAGTTDQMRTRYQQALDAYDAAKSALDRATTTIDLTAVTAALEEGRFALACVRALLAGQPEPERRAPCFFNPQHGPSVEDALWAPPGGIERDVPVCAECSARLARGEDVDARTVQVAGQSTPYWNAGPQYAGYAGGYYNSFGSVLPALLLGTILGSSMGGGFGGGWGWGGWGWGGGGGFGGGWGGSGGGGDWTGGGGGDFGGGGGGDFGGGGGGDFGGGN